MGAVAVDEAALMEAVLSGQSALISTALALLTLFGVATVAVGVFAIAAWWKRWWNVRHRLHYSVFALAMTSLASLGFYYNFISWPIITSLQGQVKVNYIHRLGWRGGGFAQFSRQVRGGGGEVWAVPSVKGLAWPMYLVSSEPLTTRHGNGAPAARRRMLSSGSAWSAAQTTMLP